MRASKLLNIKQSDVRYSNFYGKINPYYIVSTWTDENPHEQILVRLQIFYGVNDIQNKTNRINIETMFCPYFNIRIEKPVVDWSVAHMTSDMTLIQDVARCKDIGNKPNSHRKLIRFT